MILSTDLISKCDPSCEKFLVSLGFSFSGILFGQFLLHNFRVFNPSPHPHHFSNVPSIIKYCFTFS